MKVTIKIRKVATGEVRESTQDAYLESKDWRHLVLFQWGEGNYSCDCNRQMFFEEVSGDQSDCDEKCGDSAYAVDEIRTEDGEILAASDPRLGR